MNPRIFLLVLIVCCLVDRSQSGMTAWAADPGTPSYSLADILALAVEHSPTLAGAEGLVKQSHGQQIAAGAYLNPSVSGSAGRGAIRDPSTGARITERTVTVEQPLEWLGKRQARQEAANAGVAGASAALEETRLVLLADVKVGFYSLLFAQRDAELTAQNVTMVEEVLRTVKARVAAGEATSFDTMKASVEVQKAQKEVARAQNALLVAKTRLNTLTAGALGKQFSIQGDFQSAKQTLDLDRLTALGTKHRAEAERLRAQNELEQAITQHAQEVRTAQDQLHVFETGLLKQAEQTLIVARTSFRQGAASLLDVLDAQRVYRQTLLEYAQVRADLSIALVRLERSLGASL
ncbi:MAG: TolC family protein [Nitrospirae bacterium]|nr:TolC family protein [Nitrospirota bacterium]